ncbi:hypothetical protein BDR03DRAFT_942002 [Suillus americanus]|nr:hypothetical protein BDR03DRAFT_942002 [Suillus americanus]
MLLHISQVLKFLQVDLSNVPLALSSFFVGLTRGDYLRTLIMGDARLFLRGHDYSTSPIRNDRLPLCGLPRGDLRQPSLSIILHYLTLVCLGLPDYQAH